MTVTFWHLLSKVNRLYSVTAKDDSRFYITSSLSVASSSLSKFAIVRKPEPSFHFHYFPQCFSRVQSYTFAQLIHSNHEKQLSKTAKQALVSTLSTTGETNSYVTSYQPSLFQIIWSLIIYKSAIYLWLHNWPIIITRKKRGGTESFCSTFRTQNVKSKCWVERKIS